MKTYLHVNHHNIKANNKGASMPVLTVKDHKQNRKGNCAVIRDAAGNVVAEPIYR